MKTCSIHALVISVLVYFQFAFAHDLPENPEITHRVYFDITAGDINLGRVVIGLFGADFPKTVFNFYTLATTDNPEFGYLRSKIYHIDSQYFISGGEFDKEPEPGWSCLYGDHFEPDESPLEFDRPFRVAMAQTGDGKSKSQFFITLTDIDAYSGIFEVFGEVLEGHNVLSTLSVLGDKNGKPVKDVRIAASGCMACFEKYNG